LEEEKKRISKDEPTPKLSGKGFIKIKGPSLVNRLEPSGFIAGQSQKT
jgi:hypothetical protein